MSDQSSTDRPSVAEIAALTARLRALSNAGAAADPAERARFLADKDALLDRISAESSRERRPGLTGAEGPPIDAGPALTAEDAARSSPPTGAASARPARWCRLPRRRLRPDRRRSAPVGPRAADLAAIRAEQRDRPTAPAHDAAPQLHEHNAILNRDVCEVVSRHPDDGDGADPWDGHRIYTPAEAAAELVVRGVPPDDAPAVVDRYLDDLTRERGWSPQDQWELDDDDLARWPSRSIRPRGRQLPAHTSWTNANGRHRAERRAQLAAWHDATDAPTDGRRATA